MKVIMKVMFKLAWILNFQKKNTHILAIPLESFEPENCFKIYLMPRTVL